MDDERLNLVLSKILLLRFNLQRQTCMLIAGNIDKYKDQSDYRLQLTSLPANLRQNLLQEHAKLQIWYFDESSESALERNMRVAPLLLCSGTKSIDFDWLLPNGTPELWNLNFGKMLKVVTTHAPNLCELTCNRHSYVNPAELILLDDDMLNTICKESSLKRLELTRCSIKLSDLMGFCKRLPCLEHLNINIICDNWKFDKDAFKSSLGHLKVLMFKTNNIWGLFDGVFKRLCSKFTKICVELLPNLEIIGENVALTTDFSHSNKYSLRHLKVDISLLDICLCIHNQMFPNLTDLEIVWPYIVNENTREPPLRFSNIKCLFVTRLPSKNMWDLLMLSYGKSLHTLDITQVEQNQVEFSFRMIFSCCPNLDILHLTDVKVVEDLEPYDPKKLYLRELSLIQLKRDQPVLISNILCAPRLQVVILSYLPFDKEDLLKVSQLFEYHKILGQLDTLKLQLSSDTPGDIFFLCYALLKNLCVSAPKLVNVTVDLPVSRQNDDPFLRGILCVFEGTEMLA